MSKKVVLKTVYELKPLEFQCANCEKIHTQSAYCIAQVSLGRDIIYTCECNHKTFFPGHVKYEQ